MQDSLLALPDGWTFDMRVIFKTFHFRNQTVTVDTKLLIALFYHVIRLYVSFSNYIRPKMIFPRKTSCKYGNTKLYWTMPFRWLPLWFMVLNKEFVFCNFLIYVLMTLIQLINNKSVVDHDCTTTLWFEIISKLWLV